MGIKFLRSVFLFKVKNVDRERKIEALIQSYCANEKHGSTKWKLEEMKDVFEIVFQM